MEEAEDVLGLGLSAGFKFEPDDDELVEYFLLRRILGQELPLEGMIIDDDPLSAPPHELVGHHKRKDEAFFFANGQAIHGKGSRQKRTCVGGCWDGQKVCVEGDRLRVHDHGSGKEKEIVWRKYVLNFHAEGEQGSSGWVMHEYSITAPADLAASSSLRLYRIRFSGHGKNRKREPDRKDSGARAPKRQARAPDAEQDLVEKNISAAHCVVPPVVMHLVDDEDGGTASATPAATSYSDQHYHYHYQYPTHQLDSLQDLVVPDSSFLPGADVGDYAGPPAAASSSQEFLGWNTMNLATYSATSSSDQEAPSVIHEYGVTAAAAAAGMPLFELPDQGFTMDEFELPDQGFTMDELRDLLATPARFGGNCP